MRGPGNAAFVVGCLVAGSGIGGWLIFKERTADHIEQERLAALRAELDHHLEQAVRLAAAGDWKAAREDLLRLQALDARFSAVRVGELLRASEREVPNQQRLAECRAFLDRGELSGAARALAQVTPDTAQYRARETLEKALLVLADEAAAEGWVLSRFPDDGAKMQKLKAIAEDILVAIPAHRDALQLKDTADEALGRLREKLLHPSKTPWADVLAYFRVGDVGSALSLADTCAPLHARCGVLLEKLRRFDAQLERAPEDQVSLVTLEKEILGPSGGRWAADALVQKARVARSSANFVEARKLAQNALGISPGHPEADEVLGELRQRAREQLMTTIHAPSPDDRIQQLREVMQLTEPTDQYHQEAKRELEALSK